MAILFLTGPPRAGKSLRAVQYMVDNYYDWDSKLLKYSYRKKSFIHYSNIEGLNIEHVNLENYMKENKFQVEDIFNDEWAEKQKKKHKIILFTIDEAHRLFPQDYFLNKKSNNVKDYFAYHGHYNHHFLMMTQSMDLMWKPLIPFCEMEMRTVRQSMRPPGTFIYNCYPPKSYIKIRTEIKSIRKMKKYFPLYKTAQVDQTEKVKKFGLYKIMIVLVIIFPISIYYAFTSFKKFGNSEVMASPIPTKNIATKNVTTKNVVEKSKHKTKNKEKTKRIQLSYITENKKNLTNIKIVHPINGYLIPLELFEFKVKYYQSGKRIIIYTDIPMSYFPQEKEKGASSREIVPFSLGGSEPAQL